MAHDDDFEPRLGRIRARGGKRGERYLRQVLRAVSSASGRALTAAGRRSRFDGSRIGRGAGVGRALADRHAAFRARRVVIKTRLVKIGARGLKAAKLHLRYLQRDGVTREGSPGEVYDAEKDRADGNAFIERAEEDRHQFRFIVAVEDGVEYEELKGFTRRLMAQMERDLGTKLDWVAVDHFNTGHPHTHIILRGKDDRGEDLVIAREYISHGMRQRAVEIATLDLGPRTDLEIERKLGQEVDQDRLTSIDRRLLRDAGARGMVEVAGDGRGVYQRLQGALRAARLQHLRRQGLADEVSTGVWRLSDDLEATLQRMGERGDIIKTLHRALKQAQLDRGPADYAIYDPSGSAPEVTGRLVDRALHDASERQYMIVDGVDGRSHWIDIGAGDSVEHINRGAIVSVRRRPAEPLKSDRTIERVASLNDGRYSADLHAASDPHASPEFVAAHVRRLEALRRSGIVERIDDGMWQVPSDYLQAVQLHERRLSVKAPVEVDVLSPASLETLATAEGSSWLDRQLVGDTPSTLRDTGFGHEMKGALAQRRKWLIEQGLAEEREGQIVYRSNLLAILRRRELTRVAAQISSELHLPYAEFEGETRIVGKYRRRLDLVSGRVAVIERARDFMLVPWRPVLDRNLGKDVSGIVRRDVVSWNFQRQRSRGAP